MKEPLKKPLNQYFDHTVLKPEATEADVKKLCAEAREYGFYAVCVNSCYVELAVSELAGSDVRVAAVAGFPLGACATPVKAFEAGFAASKGAVEIDMVLSVGALKGKRYDYVRRDIEAVVEAAAAAAGGAGTARAAEGVGTRAAEGAGTRAAEGVGTGAAEGVGTRVTESVGTGAAEGAGTRAAEGVGTGAAEGVGTGSGGRACAVVKVILETCLLTDEEIEAACRLAEEAGAAFVKTSTGFSTGGASAHHVALMKQTVGDRLQVKASGGIRDLKTVVKMIESGADRVGASASVAIMREYEG